MWVAGCPPELKRPKPENNHHLHLVLRSRMQEALFPRLYMHSRCGSCANGENVPPRFVNMDIIIYLL